MSAEQLQLMAGKLDEMLKRFSA